MSYCIPFCIIDSRDYESKMLYMQGLSNLQLGNVAEYMDPIVANGEENQDIKFLAAWTSLSVAHERAQRVCSQLLCHKLFSSL